MAMYTRTGVTIDDHYQWCRPGTNPGLSALFIHASIPEGRVTMRLRSSRAKVWAKSFRLALVHGKVSRFCCQSPARILSSSRRVLLGAGKMGRYLKEYMDPTKSLFPWFSWLVEFHDGLKLRADVPLVHPSSCTMYAQVCQPKWLLRSQMTLALYAIIHYQHTYLVQRGTDARNV